MPTSSHDKLSNSIISEITVLFCKVWNFKLGLKGSGILVRIVKFLFPNIKRYHLDYPNFGRCNISFLDFFWIRQVCSGPMEELGLLQKIQSLKPHYPVVWDVGANSGFIAVELILRLNPEKLVLFEPNPDHEESLRSISSIDNRIQIFMNGLSDHEGSSVLHVPGELNSGSACASLNENVLSSRKQMHRVNVSLQTGDHLVESGAASPPDLIIIDVEGHEESVISGLSNTIANKKPIIVLEHLFLTDSAILKMIPKGYSLHTISDKTGALTEGIDREIGHNLLLMPSDQ